MLASVDQRFSVVNRMLYFAAKELMKELNGW